MTPATKAELIRMIKADAPYVLKDKRVSKKKWLTTFECAAMLLTSRSLQLVKLLEKSSKKPKR